MGRRPARCALRVVGAEQPRDASGSRGASRRGPPPRRTPRSTSTDASRLARCDGVADRLRGPRCRVTRSGTPPRSPRLLPPSLNGLARLRWSGCWTVHCLRPSPRAPPAFRMSWSARRSARARAELMREQCLCDEALCMRAMSRLSRQPEGPPRSRRLRRRVSPGSRPRILARKVAGKPWPLRAPVPSRHAIAAKWPVLTASRRAWLRRRALRRRRSSSRRASRSRMARPRARLISCGRRPRRSPRGPNPRRSRAPTTVEVPFEPAVTEGSEGGSDPGREVREGGASHGGANNGHPYCRHSGRKRTQRRRPADSRGRGGGASGAGDQLPRGSSAAR